MRILRVALAMLVLAGCFGGSGSASSRPQSFRLCTRRELARNTYKSACAYQTDAGKWMVVQVSSVTALNSMGVVAGRVIVEGGVQFPGVKKPLPATNTPFTFVAVPAIGKMVVRHVRTDSHGRFRLRLPPGRYRVGATFTKSEPLGQAARKVMVIHAGRVVRIRLTESVR